MEIITAGNPNLGTLASVLYLSQQHYKKRLRKVFFLDSEGSTEGQGDRSLDAERNNLAIRYGGAEVQITQQFIRRAELAQRLPRLIASELASSHRDDLVIDLTNGPKSVSSLLYAAGSLLQVGNLFFLTVSPAARGKQPEAMVQEDYWVESVDPLQNIRELGRYGFFDLVYYRETVHRISSGLPRGMRTLPATKVEQLSMRAVEEYFRENHLGCASTIGMLAEEVAYAICQRLKDRAKGTITRRLPQSFSDAISFLAQELGEPVRANLAAGRPCPDHQVAFASLRNADRLLEYARVVRNESAHPRPWDIRREEAKTLLDGVLSLLSIVSELEVSP